MYVANFQLKVEVDLSARQRILLTQLSKVFRKGGLFSHRLASKKHIEIDEQASNHFIDRKVAVAGGLQAVVAIYVRSKRSGKRVMETIEGFLLKRLKLNVNRQKSAVARPQEGQFLRFSFTSNRWLKIKLADKALKKVKHRIKKITRRSRGVSLLQVVKELNKYLRGWLGYFRLIETPTIIRDLDSWIRRRLRCYVMKQWIKNSHTRYQRLRLLGVSAQGACGVAVSRKGPWALSNAKPVKVALSNRFFSKKRLLFLLDQYELSATTT